MEFLCPENLDIRELLSKNPPREEPGRRLKEDNLLFLIDLLCILPAKRPDLVSEDGYVRLSSSLLNTKITRYQNYLRYLFKCGVIESDSSYVSPKIANNNFNRKCRGYRFCKPYQTDKKEISVENGKLIKLKESFYGLTKKKKAEYRHLLRWFDANLRIDIERALEFNQKSYNEIKDDPDKWEFKKTYHSWRGWIDSNEKKDPRLSYESSKVAIRTFGDRNSGFAVGSHSRRFFSKMTSLNKKFRPFITYQGQKLVELDVGNCQPYLLLALLNPKFWKDEHEYFNSKDLRQYYLINKFKNFLNNNEIPNSGENTPILVKLAEMQSCKGFHRYQDLVNKGVFYKTFFDAHKESAGSDHLEDDMIFSVNDLKLGFLKYLNAGYRYSSAVRNAFRMDSPEIECFVSILKKASREFQKDGFNGNALSRLLLNLETSIFLFRISSRLTKELPGLPYYTIHDCIISLQGEEESVKKIMADEFQKCIGVKPSIKIEKWTV
jgi:hypothetical protein